MSLLNPIVDLHPQNRPLIMGIVNTTPDSFSDGGQFDDEVSALKHAMKLIDEGADIIDIGGESTRPGAAEVPLEIERARTIGLIKALRAQSKIAISIDTRKPQIAEAAVKAGANMWNDVTALSYSNNSLAIAANLKVPIVIMHAQGTPETMQDCPGYKDVTTDILSYLSARMAAAIASGVKRENIILDVGIGFGKTLEHNLALIANLQKFAALGRPILFGASRKSFIGMLDKDAKDPNDRLGGSLGAALIASAKGAAILRVHDVRATKQALILQTAVLAQQ